MPTADARLPLSPTTGRPYAFGVGCACAWCMSCLPRCSCAYEDKRIVRARTSRTRAHAIIAHKRVRAPSGMRAENMRTPRRAPCMRRCARPFAAACTAACTQRGESVHGRATRGRPPRVRHALNGSMHVAALQRRSKRLAGADTRLFIHWRTCARTRTPTHAHAPRAQTCAHTLPYPGAGARPPRTR
jgi:hypothetical protein